MTLNQEDVFFLVDAEVMTWKDIGDPINWENVSNEVYNRVQEMIRKEVVDFVYDDALIDMIELAIQDYARGEAKFGSTFLV